MHSFLKIQPALTSLHGYLQARRYSKTIVQINLTWTSHLYSLKVHLLSQRALPLSKSTSVPQCLKPVEGLGGVATVLGTTEAISLHCRVQTLLQDHKHHDKFTNTYQAFQSLKCHGIGEYYWSLVPIHFHNGFSKVLFFGLQSSIKEHLPTAVIHDALLVNDLICGGLLGAMVGFLVWGYFFPSINVVKILIQSQIGEKFQPFLKVLKTNQSRIGQETDKSFQRCPPEWPWVPYLLAHNQCHLRVLVEGYMKKVIGEVPFIN